MYTPSYKHQQLHAPNTFACHHIDLASLLPPPPPPLPPGVLCYLSDSDDKHKSHKGKMSRSSSSDSGRCVPSVMDCSPASVLFKASFRCTLEQLFRALDNVLRRCGRLNDSISRRLSQCSRLDDTMLLPVHGNLEALLKKASQYDV